MSAMVGGIELEKIERERELGSKVRLARRMKREGS
jgi:hypothetical protein